jgi:hypothetical protein
MRIVSADGRYVLLNGVAPALPGSTIEISQVYRRDTLTGEIVLVSRAPGADGAPGSQSVEKATMSADGNRVAFTTRSPNLDPAANGSTTQAFVRDIAAGTTRLVSRGDGPAGAPASGGVDYQGLAISADGGTVLFPSDSVNLGAPGGIDHLYARRLATDTTLVVDRADGLAGAVGTHSISSGFGLSGDGARAVFASQSSNFGFPLGPVRVYLRDLNAGTTRMISRQSGEAGASAVASSEAPTISGDGRTAAFATQDGALAPEAGAWPPGTRQIVVRDLVTHQNRLASRGAGAGAPGNDSAGWPSLSADGGVVAWESNATNLLPGRGGDGRRAIFARTLATGALSGPPAFGRIGNYPQNNAQGASISENGSCLAFSAGGHTSSGLGSDFSTSYIHVISGECTSRLGPEPVVPGPPPPAAPLARPSLTRVSLLNPVFRVGARVQVLTRAQRRRGVIPTGTRFRFRLSTDAALRIVLQQRLPGRRVGNACRPVTRTNRARRACVRFVPRITITRASMRAGARSIAFPGRQGRKRLAPGRYRAVHRAVSAGGASVPVIRVFRVMPRR